MEKFIEKKDGKKNKRNKREGEREIRENQIFLNGEVPPFELLSDAMDDFAKTFVLSNCFENEPVTGAPL